MNEHTSPKKSSSRTTRRTRELLELLESQDLSNPSEEAKEILAQLEKRFIRLYRTLLSLEISDIHPLDPERLGNPPVVKGSVRRPGWMKYAEARVDYSLTLVRYLHGELSIQEMVRSYLETSRIFSRFLWS
ncbi:MAG: hypothetical protein DSO01_05985 [Archaeoglobi archaeon]|nr:MAG: hypothetical protein DSO01_05985 [Archaeoglobi archaeon]